jgi:hypothetical protein
VSEALKYFHGTGDAPALSFWRSADGLEVDLVIETAGRLHGIEVKANATPMPDMAERLLKWRRLMGRAAGRTALVCDAKERLPLAPKVEAVPWRETGDLCREIVERG